MLRRLQRIPRPFLVAAWIGSATVALSACTGTFPNPPGSQGTVRVIEDEQELVPRRRGSDPSLGHIAPDTAGYFLDVQSARLQDLARMGVVVERAGDHIRIVMPGAQSFASNSTDLKPEMQALLSDLGGVLREYAQSVVLIEGHSDGQGDAAYNLRLSQERAVAVGRFFVATGIDPARIAARGLGASQPVAGNDTESGRARNRRIELRVWPIIVSEA